MSAGDLAARAHEIFSALLDEPPERRAALLDRLCGGDTELRAWVVSLLEAETSEHELLDTGVSELAALLMEPDPAGRVLGSYRVLGELGRGGMGTVYLAERADGEYEQQVALKIIRDGPDAEALARRFRRERQILATLRHPNIAQLLDGGRSPEGHPFLAMEYVEGERIDRYCDRNALGLEARLQLFATACAAVDHAHRNLIVHRDLKPAHIMITPDGTVKLLDFGIAKLMAPEGDDPDATLTAVGAFTPRYSSPEQIRNGPITPSTDVYALGAILYELLAGTLPFPDTGDPFETARARLEADPPRPSTVAPPGLRGRLRGDLDAIVLRALRREPAERYATAAQLADDIGRWLRHQPVAARSQGLRYRARKFARRHRAAVAGAVLAIGGVTASTVFHVARVTGERDRAELAARKATEVQEFLLSLFTSSYPRQALGDTLRVTDLLERGVARADSITDQPELRALLLVTLGDVFRELADYDRAETLLTDGLDAYRAMPDPPPLELAAAIRSMALLHWDLQRYEENIRYVREEISILRRELRPDDPRLIPPLGNLATALANTGQTDEALELHGQVLELRRRLDGPDQAGVPVTLNNIGGLLYRLGRYEEAEGYLSEALELRRRLLDPLHPDLSLSVNNLAGLYRQQGRLEEAEPLLREALESRRRVLGDNHPRVAISHFSLGRVLHMRGELHEAEVHLRTALDIDRRAYGPDHPEVAVDSYQLGAVLAERGDCEAARPHLAAAVAIFDQHGRAEELANARVALDRCASP